MKEQMKNPLVVIAGPTAVGKSEIAAELGRKIGGEVISADSMQVYRYMDIGSAKVTLEEMLGVPHHMIDVVDPTDSMDVSRYASMAKKEINTVLQNGHIPILCGGTGFYIQAVTRDIDFEGDGSGPDEKYREELLEYARIHGNDALHEELARVDPESAREIHPNNLKRVIRALEYYKETGRTISEHNKEEEKRESPYHLAYFVIDEDREVLYEKIDQRVDFMMKEGLVDEVQYLKAMGLTREHVSMQGLGYKEMLDYLDGKYSLEEAVRILKRDSRHYAKRQITWFKREKDAIWIERKDFQEDPLKIVEYITEYLKRAEIL